MKFIINFFDNFISLFIDMSFYILLGLLFVGILHVFIKKEKIVKHLGRGKISSVIKSSIVGVPLPLCSCGVVPTAIELKKNGASNGAVIAFLVSTPQTGVDSIFATYSLMGLFMAVLRPTVAFISGIISGICINLFIKENNEVPIITEEKKCCCHAENEESVIAENNYAKKTLFSKLYEVLKYSFIDFLGEISKSFIIGLLLAALITCILPNDFFSLIGMSNGIGAMFLMIIIGVPMYICSVSSIPIALSLISKGASLGTGFVFLFVGPVTNIASIIVLSKSLGKKLTAAYISCVIVCSTVFGLLIDLFVSKNIIDYSNLHGMHEMHSNLIQLISAAILGILILVHFINFIKNKKTNK